MLGDCLVFILDSGVLYWSATPAPIPVGVHYTDSSLCCKTGGKFYRPKSINRRVTHPAQPTISP
jgi:hypothetical protein